jgi:hypothetical protein
MLNWDSDQIITILPQLISSHHNSTPDRRLFVVGGAEWRCVDFELGRSAWAWELGAVRGRAK